MSYNLNLSLKNINNLSEEILSDKSEFKKIKKNFNTTINTPEDLIIVSDILFANNKETPLLNSLCRKIFNYKISDFFPLVDELNPQDIKRLSLMVETNYTSLTDTTCQIVNSTRFHKKIVVDFDSILKFNPILETRLKNFNHASTYCHYFIHQKNFDTFLSPIFSSENLNLSDIIHFFQFWQKQGTATNKPNSLSEYFLDNSSILNNVLQQFEKITINLEMDSKNIHYLKNSMDSFISDYPKIFNKVFHSSNKFCDRNNITFNQFIIPSITSEMVKEKNIDLIIKKLTYTICQTSNCTKNLVKINHIFTNCVLLFEEYPLLSNYLSKNSLSNSIIVIVSMI